MGNPSHTGKSKLWIWGCLSLLVSLACLVSIPVTFLLTMGFGMGTGSGNLTPDDLSLFKNLTFGGMFFLGVSILVTAAAGIAGIVLLISWAVRRKRA
jgi:hypothetical protein